MIKIAKFLFLLFLYCSNISTAIFIYPIIYFIFGVDKGPIKWYYFGIIFSVYEFGKCVGLILWEFISHKFSFIILILISLSFLCILNISYMFSFNIYHILLIRFFSGFFNNIGKYSKDIYIQLGLKDKHKFIIFTITIICTITSLFLPSFVVHKIKQNNNITNNISKIYLFTIIFAIFNLISILLCLILIFNKNLKIRKKNKNFIQMSNSEKLDYSRNIQNKENIKTPQSTVDSNNRTRELKYSKKYINLKIKDNIDNQNSGRNINVNLYGDKMSSNRYISNKKEDESKLGKRGSLNLFASNKSSETGVKEGNPQIDIKINYNIKNKPKKSNKTGKKIKFTIIHVLIEINDALYLIWTLIFLYNEFKGNCLYISFFYAFIRILGEIISFPINSFIIKNTSYYSQYQSKNISKKVLIMNILLFFATIVSNASIFIYYYYIKNKIMLFILLAFVLIRNIFNTIISQLFKIISAKDFNIHSKSMISLRKYKQRAGSIFKTLIFLVGSYGYYLIYNIFVTSFSPIIFKKLSNLIFILYFVIFPIIITFLLIITCKFFI